MSRMKTTYIFNYRSLLVLVILGCALGCRRTDSQKGEPELFSLIPASHSHVVFTNKLKFNKEFNVFTYRNFYDGGGVALGDVNNDGLLDIYLVANEGPNHLYLNEGNFKFRDVTNEAGASGVREWSTGVTMADVNGDGLLDIYVCNSGPHKGEGRANELFINQGIGKGGIPHFKDEAAQMGVADSGESIQGAFFDYDEDGDLDLYVLNNSYTYNVLNFKHESKQRDIPNATGGDRLYRNDGGLRPPEGGSEGSGNQGATPSEGGLRRPQGDSGGGGNQEATPSEGGLRRPQGDSGGGGNQEATPSEGGHFTDVTKQAGIYSSVIGFGLGVTVSDYNRDGWPDMYISNDFYERDYLYLNNHDGTFREVLPNEMSDISAASMGSDAADINNDGYPDIFVTDMLPRDEKRLKINATFDSWKRYRNSVKNGFFHQFTRNTLQLNNGDGTFSEVGRLAGVEATDWSWGALMFDMDDDGYNDIFVANGIYRDIINLDYLNYISRRDVIQSIVNGNEVDYKKLIALMPGEPIPNYAFHNNGNLSFADSAAIWGLAQPGFSNGAAYGDLNNDGAVDLVVNNINMPAFIYRNNADSLRPGNHRLTVKLKGVKENGSGIGAELTGWAGKQFYYREQMPTRGFESSVGPRVHFGLGRHKGLDSLQVRWPDGRVSMLYNVTANQMITVQQSDAKRRRAWGPDRFASGKPKPLLRKMTGPDWRHHEDSFNDFARNHLLPRMHSREGPKLCVGDVNSDGRADFYVGGAKGQPGALFVQEKDGSFRLLPEPALNKDRLSEDAGCAFLDADGDGDQDLYVAGGSDEFPASSEALADRLYLNLGQGRLIRSPRRLPAAHYVAGSCVLATDYDKDGHPDLFVGGRLRPFAYGLPAGGRLLKGDGKGGFRDVTAQSASGLAKAGMITDGLWCDINADGWPDLIVVGQWMGIRVWENQKNGRFREITRRLGLANMNGWWNTIGKGDLNGDGRPDFVAGNLGLNSRLRASRSHPVRMYISDFNHNGLVDQVITSYNGDKAYPLALRHELLSRLPGLRDKYPSYASYQDQTIGDIFTPKQLEAAMVDSVVEPAGVELLSVPGGKYKVIPLPERAQFSPVCAVLVRDLNGDGKADVLLGGNLYGVKPQLGRYAASRGLLLLGDGRGGLTPLSPEQSGFDVYGQIRDLQALPGPGGNIRILVAVNNDSLQMYKTKGKNSENDTEASGQLPRAHGRASIVNGLFHPPD